MRRVWFVLAVCLSLAVPCLAGENRDVTGLEWLEMGAWERSEQVVRSMAILSRAGAEPKRTPNEYYDALHARLRRDPAAYGTTVTNLLAAYVYETEPASRAALDAHAKPKETTG